MKEKPLVSVLIPVYNAALHVERAVKSIMNQSYTNLEINIIDDGSNDESKAVIEKLVRLDNRIKFVSRENRGLAKTLNELLAMSNGKYCARMDADDYSFPDRIEKQVKYMEKNSNVAVLGTSVCLSNTGQILSEDNMLTYGIRKTRMLFSNAGVVHPTAMFRKEFLEKENLRYKEDLVTSEDFRLWIEIVLHDGEIQCLNDVMLEYQVSDNQMTSRYREEMKSLDIQNQLFMLENIGNFSEKEKELLKCWKRYSESVNAKEYCDFVLHMCKQLKKDRKCMERDVECELCFQWILKAFLQVKYSHDLGMLFSKFSLQIVFPDIFIYVVRNLMKLKQKKYMHKWRR